MSWLVFLFLLFLSQFFINQNHPIYLGGVLMVFGIFSTFVVCFYVSPLVGVCSFLVLVGGVLVVFSYSVALVPFYKKDHFEVKKFSASKLVVKNLLIFASWVFCMSQVEGSSFSFFFSSSLYFGDYWSKMVMFLGLYLLFAMIAAARMCSAYKGALVR
uniref:NADH dehydrogenase subunit 6 n=1 Tax=Mactra alta TaxID=1131947 RepID=UPI00286CFD3D|nr:NADH dehydrogenase subunit 6 [Mactra alta]WLS55685.1 NADH dehydrogenase subunit 6 [Mactra alta]